MRRRNNRKYYVAILLAVILTVSLGFAIFSEILNITGSAKTKGNFDLEFNAATVAESSKAGTPSATISTDKNTLTLVADDLAEPGSFVKYNVVVKNVGSIDSKLKMFDIIGNNDPDIVVAITPALAEGTLISAGSTQEFTITVTWALNSTVGDKTLNYSIELDYEQAS